MSDKPVSEYAIRVYLADHERSDKAVEHHIPPRIRALRRSALERFCALGFPSAKREEWRFTNVAPLANTPFHLARQAGAGHLPPGALDKAGVKGLGARRLVFLNGRYDTRLSSPGEMPAGVRIGSLMANLAHADPQAEGRLGESAPWHDHSFVALNTAFIGDGAFIHVPRGVVIEEPILLIFISIAAEHAVVSHPRNLIIAERESQVCVVESYYGPSGETYFTNAVTEIFAGEGARVGHYKLQREGDRAWHMATVGIRQERDSACEAHSAAFGAGFSRNDVTAVLGGAGCSAVLNGLTMISGSQFADNHTRIDHAQPRCESQELYKGIFDERARGVFNGRIIVRQDAQKTSAMQTNKNLLLTGTAMVNTNPQLEIFADDVKCSHGATVGRIDDEHIFYLRARGISFDEARSIMTYAFANDVIRRIKPAPLRVLCEQIVLAVQDVPADFIVTEEK
ncbi:MAG: Fe-S cluster assembly protein SufD [bacterium]|nr:Fe-S cluster assembly protein SufD [Candidatus Sumerlaeota bacterium]